MAYFKLDFVPSVDAALAPSLVLFALLVQNAGKKVVAMMLAGPKATTVERALLVLEALDSARRGLNISELSRRLRIPKSSTHVIVHTLERLGYVQKRSGSLHYSLGLKAYALGHSMTKNLSVSEVALPHMRALVDQLRLSAHLAVPDGDQGVYIQKVEAPGLIKIDTYVGRRMDLHCTAVGKVILAFGPPDLLERLLAKPVYIRHTRNTITSPKQLQREVVRVRKLVYAVDDEEEEPAVRCVAVPVSHAGRFAAGLSVTGTTTQIPMSEVQTIAACLRRLPLGSSPQSRPRHRPDSNAPLTRESFEVLGLPHKKPSHALDAPGGDSEIVLILTTDSYVLPSD